MLKQTLKEEVEAIVQSDPLRAVRVFGAQELIRAVGCILTAGASEEELREVFEESLRVALDFMAQLKDGQSAGQAVDWALLGGIPGAAVGGKNGSS